MGMGFLFSSDTLEFLIIGTGILRKIRLGNGIETPLQGPQTLFASICSCLDCRHSYFKQSGWGSDLQLTTANQKCVYRTRENATQPVDLL